MHLAVRKKLAALEQIVGGMPGAVVAYSGGADSALVADVAYRSLGGNSLAVIADSPSLPRAELAEAAALAGARGWRLEIIGTGEIEDESYAANPSIRCYFCRHALMEELTPLANRLGWEVLLGTNLDDLGDWRPGLKAADEAGARHPLVEAEMTKSDVREASLLLGLPTAGKASSPCLASRIAYGTRVTPERLSRIEQSEAWLKSLGYASIRVRDLGSGRASIEVAAAQVARLLAEPRVGSFLQSLGFTQVEIDPKGYRQGSLNEALR